MKWFVPFLLVLLVLPVVSQARAWYLERPGASLGIIERVENGTTDGAGSVGLGAFITDYHEPGTGQNSVDMNISMTADCRAGIKYTNVLQDYTVDALSWIPPCDLLVSSVVSQVGDSFIVPVDFPQNFPPYGGGMVFRFFGGRGSAEYTCCYVSSNGFVSFDNASQPSPNPSNITTPNRPNALIAAVWTDLNVTGGDSNITTGIYYSTTTRPGGAPCFVVIWNNVLEESSRQRLTFEIIMEDKPVLTSGDDALFRQSDIWITYHDLSNINASYGRGIKDQGGHDVDDAVLFAGDSLGSLNGESLRFMQLSNSYVLNQLTLTLSDTEQNSTIWIYSDLLRGYNLGRDIINAGLDSGWSFANSLAGTVTLFLGALGGPEGLIAGGGFIIDQYLCAESWAQTYLELNQWNHVYATIFDIYHGSFKHFANATALTWKGAVDASLDLHVSWFLDDYLASHSLTITAHLDYDNVDISSGQHTGITLNSTLNLNICPDGDDSPRTAQTVSSGTLVNRTIIGYYDQEDCYNISLSQGDNITVQADAYNVTVHDCKPIFHIYLYDPGGNPKNWTGDGYFENASCIADTSGNWTIQVNASTTYTNTWGYYWLYPTVDKHPDVPTLSGPRWGVAGTSYRFNASTTDPEGNNVTYTFNWTDGSPLTQVGPNASGVQVSASHAWNSTGQPYWGYVTVQAADSYGALSNWSSPMSIVIRDPALIINPVQGSGTTNPAPGTHYYSNGTYVSVLATPATNWSFSCWALDGEVRYVPNPIGITMNGDHNLKAYFYYNPPGGSGGGCPYVSTWNGTCYVLDNNVLPDSEANDGNDSQDYYALQQQLVPAYVGKAASLYSLKLSEFEHEQDWIDQVVLTAVDHPSGVNVTVSPSGEILTYGQPAAPTSAVSNDGLDVLSLLNVSDGDYYQGYNGSYVSLTFAAADVSAGAKLVIRSEDPWLKCPIYVQVLNSTGQWNAIDSFHTRTNWTTDVINVTGYLPDPQGDFEVRLYFVSNDKIDYVGLDTTPQASIQVHTANLLNALSSSQGIVTRLLNVDDEKYAKLLPGQQILLTFQLPNSQNSQRTFILYTEGHYQTIN
jgi:hypothetical protein